MKFYFIDDSNITKEFRCGFFIYGGIIVDEKNLLNLTKKFIDLKKDKNINIKTEIKWTHENTLSEEEHKNFKEKVLNLIATSNCKIIIYLAPQDFYHKLRRKKSNLCYSIDPVKQLKSLEYAINVCMQKFNSYLEETSSSQGLILADESDSYDKKMKNYYLSILERGTRFSSLEKISYSIIPIDSKYSQMHQVNDVVIGAIQHSLKEFQTNFLPILKNNFWKKNLNTFIKVTDYGFNVYPKHPKTKKVELMLDQLSEKFSRLINKKI